MPRDEPTAPGSGYVREEQHRPEMDDTQVEATGELADTLDPVTDDDED
jgi:hypothetical protein